MALSSKFKEQTGVNWETGKAYTPSTPTTVTKPVVQSTPNGIVVTKPTTAPTLKEVISSTPREAISSGGTRASTEVKQESSTPKEAISSGGTRTQTETINKPAEVYQSPYATNTVVPAVTPMTYAPAIDNSGLIKQQSAELVNALKAQIQQSINNKNMAISGLSDKYTPLKNEASSNASQNVISLQEMLANRGDRGGIANSTLTDARMGGQRNIANYEMQQKDQEANLRNDIANLMLEGNIQEAEVQSDKLKNLIANSTAMDTTNYQRGQDAYVNAVTERNTLLNQVNADRSFAQTQANTDRSFGLQERQIGNQEANDAFNRDIETKRLDLTTRQFDNSAAQQLMDNQYRSGVFNYQKERDKVADTANGKQYQLALDQFAWQKDGVNNPAVKSQIIENNIKDLQLGYMKDPNSPENQTRLNQAAVFKKQLDDLMAISPEMKVKQFNAELDNIYQNIVASKASVSQGQQQVNISQQNANTNESARKDSANNANTIRQDTLNNKKDQDDYSNIYNSILKLNAVKIFDKFGTETGIQIPDNKKAEISKKLYDLENNKTISKSVADMLYNTLDVKRG